MKSPAFQFYAHDFLGGRVATYSLEEVGLYSVLLAFDWSLNGLPKDDETLARLARVSVRKFRVLWRRVGENFTERDGRYFNPRLELEREKQRAWREKSAKGGKASATKRGSTTLEPPLPPNGSTPSPTPTPVTTKNSTTPRAARGAGEESAPRFELGPFKLAYLERFPGADFPGARFGKTLKRLVAKHSHDEVLRRWRVFLPQKGELGPEYFARTWSEWDAPAPLRVVPGVNADAEAAWGNVLALLPAWQRREITAERHAQLDAATRRGLSAVGGFAAIHNTPADKRTWLKRDFVAAFSQTSHHAGAA